MEVEAATDSLGPSTNYSYSLRWDNGAASAVAASAASPFGVGYAMETLLQLASPKAQLDCGSGFMVLDTPAYPHRGLLLDTGRRFYPLKLLKSTIDAMAMFKLNVLHLHLNENRFRVESKAFPLLNQPQNCSECGYYTQDDVAQLVAFAHARGVRVIPEFELTAHAAALCTAWKGSGVPKCCSGVYTPQLPNDSSGNTSRLIGQLLKEMAVLFPDPIVHIGGDEARYTPGSVGPCTINATQSLQEDTMKQLMALGKQPMGWQEILLQTGAAALFPSAIIDTWSKAGTWAEVAAAANLRSVVSLPSSLYLDGSVTSGGATVRGGYRPGVWFDISAGALNASNKRFLLGGETSMCECNNERCVSFCLPPLLAPLLACV
jgi:hexosaminidase